MLYQIDTNQINDARVSLALEEFCLRHLSPGKDYLILYVNDPAVVIGRHQNPLEETDQCFVNRNRIQTVRRISGGGAVYHDPGNLNFSFIHPYDRTSLVNLQDRVAPIVNGLQTLGVDARIDGRNAILIGGRKVSGNSQFTDTRRILVHGTLLFNSNLDHLHAALRPTFEGIVSDSPKSIKSTVTNIINYVHGQMDLTGLQQHLLQSIAKMTGGVRRHRLNGRQWDQILNLAEKKYGSWEWTYGKTPAYAVHKKRPIDGQTRSVVIRVKNGRIHSVDLEHGSIMGITRSSLLQQLSGIQYDPVSIEKALRKLAAEKSVPSAYIPHLLALIY